MSAVTITKQPSTYLNSANNPSIFMVSGSSDASASLTFDFSYIAQVLVNGSPLVNLVDVPDPVYGVGKFDLGNIVNKVVSYDIILDPTDTAIFHTASHSSAQIQVLFGKEYSYPGGFTQSLAEVSSSVFAYLNSSLPFLQQGTNMNNYLVTSVTSSTVNFLTSATFPIPTYTNLKNWLYYYLSSSAATFLNIRTYDSSNTMLGQYYIPNYLTSTNGVQIISSGYPQLSILTSGSGINQYTPNVGSPAVMFNQSVVSYDLQLIGIGNVPYTTIQKYQIVQDCGRYSSGAFQVMWLNEWGGVDSWNMNKKNQTTTAKTQSTYKKIQGKITSTSTYSLNSYSPSRQVYYTELSDQIELTSDFLSDAQVLYLRSMFSSPVIYLTDPSGNVFATTVNDTDYVVLKRVNTKSNSIKITFTTSYNDYRQAL